MCVHAASSWPRDSVALILFTFCPRGENLMYRITVLSRTMPQAFISIQQLLTQSTKQEWHLYETSNNLRQCGMYSYVHQCVDHYYSS